MQHALNITALYIDANNNEIKRCHCCTQVNSIKKIVFFFCQQNSIECVYHVSQFTRSTYRVETNEKKFK